MTRNTILTTLVVTGIALLGGCMRTPEVELTGVRVGGIGFSGATLLAELRIENPNRFGLEADSVTFRLDAQDPQSAGTWTEVTSGTNPQRMRVGAGSTANVEIPIEFAYARLGAPLRAITRTGRFNYRVNGEVFVRRPVPKRIPFSQEGSLSLFTAQ
jgi:LEA14-like dessication related protein